MAEQNVAIIIVNWNSGKQLKTCVESINQFGGEHIKEIIVVDNASTDGSEYLVNSAPNVVLIRAGENLGFGKACNLGGKYANCEYLLFLNPDTVMFEGTINSVVNFMQKMVNKNLGICGIQLVDETGEISRSCSRFPTLKRLTVSALGLDKLSWMKTAGMKMAEWSHDYSRKVDQVIGAFFLIRKDVFEECKGFDERFFVYFEEVDLSKRAKLAGWDSWYLAEAKAFHAGGGTSHQVKAKRLFYSLRSRILYAFKHFPAWQAWLLLVITSLVEPFTRTIWSILQGDIKGLRQIWSAYGMLWRSMTQIIRGEGRCNP